MPADWLPVWERILSKRAEGGTYLTTVPWRFTVHTTEVIPSTIAGARALASRHEFPPHVWAWPGKDWVGQTVRLDRSAFALKHTAGTVETNKARALQVEVIGLAADSPLQPDSFWLWIGRRVLAPIIAAGYPVNLNHLARVAGSDGSGTGGKVRMTRSEWQAFNGIHGHANVPANSHWDPGMARYDLIARGARDALNPGDDMDPTQIADLFARLTAISERLDRLEKRVGTDNTGKDLSDEMDLVRQQLRVIAPAVGAPVVDP